MQRISTAASLAIALLTASVLGTVSPAHAACFRERVVDRWPSAVVPVFLHESLSDEQRATFANVAEYVQLMTDIRFEARLSDGPGVLAIRQYDESEYVPWTRTIRWHNASHYTLLHEFSHAIGLEHEQQRSDRNDTIEVLPQNILPGSRHAYEKLEWPTPIGEFDFDSVMMYHSCSHIDLPEPEICNSSTDESLLTMRRVEPDPVTGSRFIAAQPDRYSVTDQSAIHQYYSGLSVDAVDVTIESAADAAAFCAAAPLGRIIVGDVRLAGSDSLVIPCLKRVVGDVTVQDFEGDLLELPSLVSVSGTVRVVDAPNLGLVDLSMLRVAQDVDLLSLPTLDSLSLGLEVVFGELLVVDLPVLRDLDLSSLRRAGHVRIDENDALRSVDANRLEVVASHPVFGGFPGAMRPIPPPTRFEVAFNPELQWLSVPQLRVVGEVSIEGNASLRQANLPLLGHDAAGEVMRVEVLRNTALQGVSLDALTVVGTLEIIENSNEVFAIHVPVLQLVFGSFRVVSNPFLTRLEASQLAGVADPLDVSDNRRLTYVGLPMLTDAAALEVEDNPVLHTVDLPKLANIDTMLSFTFDGTLGYVSFRRNPALLGVRLPALATVSSSFSVESCGSVSTLDLPLLTESDDLLVSGTSLVELTLPSLATVGDITVASNPQLDRVLAAALADEAGVVRVFDNASLRVVGSTVTMVDGLFVIGNGHAGGANLVLGLQRLTEIAGEFEVDENPTLQSFRHLDPSLLGSLEHVVGDARLRTVARQAAQNLVDAVPQWDGVVSVEDL